jgi:hypothetical protein
MWTDGPEWTVKELSHLAVDARADRVGEAPPVFIDGISPKAVMEKYKCWLDLSENLDGYIGKGDKSLKAGIGTFTRSHKIWKVGCLVDEAGASRDEVAAVVYATHAWRSKYGPDSIPQLAEIVEQILTRPGRK